MKTKDHGARIADSLKLKKKLIIIITVVDSRVTFDYCGTIRGKSLPEFVALYRKFLALRCSMFFDKAIVLLAFFHHASPRPSSNPSMHHFDLQFIPHREGERQENRHRWKTRRA